MIIKCDNPDNPECGGDMKCERLQTGHSWNYVFICEKCGYRRLPTVEEREEWTGKP